MNINSRLKGAVDRELGEIYTVFVSPIFGKLNFDECCRNPKFLVRFLRIHPVQSVVNNIAHASGRGFPCIFHTELFVLQLYVFWYFKIEAGPYNLKICKFGNSHS